MSNKRSAILTILIVIVMAVLSSSNVYDSGYEMKTMELSPDAKILAAGVNLISNPGFETGSFSPWVDLGSSGYNVIQNETVYSGEYALYMDSHLSSAPYEPVYQEIDTSIPLSDAQIFKAAILPTKVGNTAGQAGVDQIWIGVLNQTSGTWKNVFYEWSGYTYPGGDLGVNVSKVLYLLFDLTPNVWNVIERNLYSDYCDFYGTPENTTELVVNRITLLSHSSNGDPGDFYVDDLYVGTPSIPEIDSPDDIEFEVGTLGEEIQWNATSSNPSSYNITRNGALVSSDSWNESIITQNLDGLSIGYHTFVLRVYDDLGFSASDSVLVAVMDSVDPTLNSPDDIVMNVGSDVNITWIAVDSYPDSYHVYVNSTEIASGTLNSTAEQIVVDLSSLEVGAYEFQIVITDTWGNEASDSVIVAVLLFPDAFDVSLITVIASGATIIVIVIIIVKAKN